VRLTFLQTWYRLPLQNTTFLSLVNADTVSYGGAKAAAGLNGRLASDNKASTVAGASRCDPSDPGGGLLECMAGHNVYIGTSGSG
jgi:hypothetical protein